MLVSLNESNKHMLHHMDKYKERNQYSAVQSLKPALISLYFASEEPL